MAWNTQKIDASTSPGLAFVIKKEWLDQLKESMHNFLVNELDHIHIPDVEDKTFELKDIIASVELSSPQDIEIVLEEKSNSFEISIVNTSVYVSLEAHYKSMFVTITGSLQGTANIDKVSTMVQIGTQRRGVHYIPKFTFQNSYVNMSKDSVEFMVNWSLIPNCLINSIINFFKGRFLEEYLKNYFEEFFDTRLSKIINRRLTKCYPTEVEILKGVSASIGLARAPVVKSDHLVVLLDGTIYFSASGYIPSTIDSEITLPSIDELQTASLFINGSLLKSISRALKCVTYSKELKVIGHKISIWYDGSVQSANFKCEQDKIEITGQLRAEIPKMQTVLLLKIQLMIAVEVSSGDKEHLIVFKPMILHDSLQVEIEKYFLEGTEMQKNSFWSLIQWSLKKAAQKIKLKPIRIKNLKRTPLYFENVTLKITPANIQIRTRIKSSMN
jgi:hypothetical protein